MLDEAGCRRKNLFVPNINNSRRLILIGSLLFAIAAGCGKSNGPSTGKSLPPQLKSLSEMNSQPRRDVNGQIVDAHDGCLQFFNGRYYLYGTAYGTNDGFGNGNRYRVYSSRDLAKWTLEGDLLKAAPPGVYYSPYVVFNPNTHKYVLWYNWYPKLWDGKLGVAVSDTPTGPFTIVHTDKLHSRPGSRAGVGTLFVDNDGHGYCIFTAMDEDYGVRILALTPDYLGLTGEASQVILKGAECSILIRRNDLYYILSGPLCCLCPQGTIVQVLTATSPFGPYTVRSQINRRSDNGEPIIPAQETWIATIPTSAGPTYLWMGDRWKSSPDGAKGHDFQYWTLLAFNPNGDILPIK